MVPISNHAADAENAFPMPGDGHRIRAVVFDAVGTVMYPQPGVADVYQRAIQQHCGVHIGTDVVGKAVREALTQRSAGGDLRTNEDSEREFWAGLIRELCPNSSGFQSCFDDLFAHFASADNWRCFPDVRSTLANLHTADVILAIASNFDRRLNSVCHGLPELTGVSHRIISSVAGWRKPAEEFFQAVVDTLRIPAKNILMVGDDLTNDVQGALAAGMQAAWICRDSSVAEEVPPGAVRIDSLGQLGSLVSPTPEAGSFGKESRGA